MKRNDEEIILVQRKILNWYKKNKRDLPWRKTSNPYFIMVAEFMLQQTQVSRTIEKYLEFIEAFPTLECLATAKTADVLKVWSGMGYNRRALWLQQAAQQIITLDHFPETPGELEKLKGIGKYTSRAILIFAFNKNYASVDTNIRRILITEGFADETTSEKELFVIAEKLLPKGKAREWHNALMDYGSSELTAAKTGIKPTSRPSSKNYKKTNRYFRGQLVKFLTSNSRLTKKQLISKIGLEQSKIDEILEGLIKDGLISKSGRYYHLPE
jgi:A/G-specific adenine glycosylase